LPDEIANLFQFGHMHRNDLGVCAIGGAASPLVLELRKAHWFLGPLAEPAAPNPHP